MNSRFASPGKKWMWLLIFSMLIILLTAFFFININSTSKKEPSASTAAENSVSCLGRLLPGGRILRVAAPPGAIIGDLLIQRGQWIEKNSILAHLRDHAHVKALLRQLEKEVTVAESEYDRVKAGEKISTIEAQQSVVARQDAIFRQEQINCERCQKLSEKGLITIKEFEEARTRSDSERESLLREQRLLAGLREIRKEDIALASNKIEAAKEALKAGQENLELTIVRAPVSGRILEIYAFPGEAVMEQGILELGTGRDMLVEAEVYVSDIGRVRTGASASVSGDAFPENLKGEVIEIAAMVTRSAILTSNPLAFTDQKVVKVWIRLNNPQAVANLGNHQVNVLIKS